MGRNVLKSSIQNASFSIVFQVITDHWILFYNMEIGSIIGLSNINWFNAVLFQIMFRCITFILNAFIIRHVGQDVLGIMNVRLLLLESTILFLSKEPLLKACLTDTKSHNWAQVINQIWLSWVVFCLLENIMLLATFKTLKSVWTKSI